MQILSCISFISVLVLCFVNGHVVNNSNIHSTSDNNYTGVYNNTDTDVDSNSTDVINATASSTTSAPVTEENRVFRIRERVHSRNRRFRLRRIRIQILRTLGWTEPPVIPEDLRRQINSEDIRRQVIPESLRRQVFNNNTIPLMAEEGRCFSSSCSLPRQIDRHLWRDESLGGFRVFMNIPSRHDITPSTLRSAHLNVFLTHIEGFTCHGEEVPVSRTGSRFLVSVYQFIRPLRFQRSRNRVLNRKRLIDALMVTTSGHTWVTLDVRQAVLEWISGDRHNFGFEIIVKDENETECNAVNMFVPGDCYSPTETGCREESISGQMEDIEDNYPYLEIVTRQRSPLGRHRRDVTEATSLSPSRRHHRHDDTQAPSLFPSRTNNGGMCQGREVRVNLYETSDSVIAPMSYTTLECGGTCATAYNGMLQILVSRCRPTQQRQLTGLYFDENLQVRLGPLPYTQVLQCGC